MSQEEILTSECLHSLRSSSHADKLDVSEHLLQVVGAGAQGQVVEDVLAQLLDVRVHQPHLVPPLAPAGTGLRVWSMSTYSHLARSPPWAVTIGMTVGHD